MAFYFPRRRGVDFSTFEVKKGISPGPNKLKILTLAILIIIHVIFLSNHIFDGLQSRNKKCDTVRTFFPENYSSYI